jgi:xylan 1,4-beta-xylosidase
MKTYILFQFPSGLITLSILLFVASPGAGAQNAQLQQPARRVIDVDYYKIKGAHNQFFRQVVGAGRAAEGLRADWLRDLAVVHRECGFKYIRFHGLLQDELGVYSEDRQGRPIFNFQYIDTLYDAILGIGMKPFVELSFMPQALSSGAKTVFWWKGNITPPKDYDKWQQLIQALVQHWTSRYGAEEVRQWYFEVWNEPNLDIFWSGNQAEYFKLYDVTARAIKSVSPNYRVGGPATAGHAWISETIDFAAKNRVALDFISTHDYGVKGIGFDEGGQQLKLITDPDAIIGGVRDVRAQIASSQMPKLPLHYTEWSTSYSPRDPVHDSYISAPYILSKLKGTERYADSMSYWTFTDIFEENGPVPSPFHGGFGLLNFQGLRKPSFYAYQFLNRLGDVELDSGDPDSWACRDTSGAQLLFWNYTPPVTEESNQKFFTRDLPAKDFGPVRVQVKSLPPGDYQMNVYRVGYQVNDVYTAYLKLGSPANLSREQIRKLAEQNNGRAISSTRVRISTVQPFVHDVLLRENEGYLITLERQSSH